MKYFTILLFPVFSLVLGVSIPKGLFEGDIAGIDPSDEKARNAVVDEDRLWPEGIVYYEIDTRLKDFKDVILEAMQEFESKTCLQFRPKNEHTKDYVKFAPVIGCWSAVGRQGGGQDISLSDSKCLNKISILHELGHAIGLWHEHSRSDRDDYLEIFWNNIQKGKVDNFKKLEPWENNLLDEEFDYQSVMLYGEHAFSKDKKSMTIKPKKEGVVIGPIDDKRGLSDGDVRKINKLYQCFGNVRPPPVETPDFKCDFEKDMCEMNNEAGYQWKIQKGELGGRTGSYIAVNARDVGHRKVPLKTPFLNSNGRKNGCLSFDLYFNGAGAASLDVMSHSVRKSTKIFKDVERKDTWQSFRINLDLDGEDTLIYVFEARMRKSDGDGIIALDNIRYALRKCD